jgi:uncharacterized membrane-anchored protein
VVALFGHVVEGLHDKGVPVEPTLATAVFVPTAVLTVWWTVRRIRRKHIGRET